MRTGLPSHSATRRKSAAAALAPLPAISSGRWDARKQGDDVGHAVVVHDRTGWGARGLRGNPGSAQSLDRHLEEDGAGLAACSRGPGMPRHRLQVLEGLRTQPLLEQARSHRDRIGRTRRQTVRTRGPRDHEDHGHGIGPGFGHPGIRPGEAWARNRQDQGRSARRAGVADCGKGGRELVRGRHGLNGRPRSASQRSRDSVPGTPNACCAPSLRNVPRRTAAPVDTACWFPLTGSASPAGADSNRRTQLPPEGVSRRCPVPFLRCSRSRGRAGPPAHRGVCLNPCGGHNSRPHHL